MPLPAFPFEHRYADELPGLYTPWQPTPAPAPRLLFLNHALADELGLDGAALGGDEGAALFAGNALPEGARPIAQAYAGHQFGGFSPRLGDGRALLLGELIDRGGRRRDLAFKGSGRTPYARGGDGKAAVGPMLREVLLGEAMHALGVPTTRALAVAATGDGVPRDAGLLPGAVLTRVAASHLRVGSFEYAAAQRDTALLRRLLDHALWRHEPDAPPADAPADARALALLRGVAARQARLIAMWMNLGFIHGVMNTDNMTISGETIDYGPCAFVEAYDPGTVFSSIDREGRYAFGRQPAIAQWNLARLAEALLPLVAGMPDDGGDPGDDAIQRAVARVTEVLDAFPEAYRAALLQGQRAKLGLPAEGGDDAADRQLADGWLALLQAQRADFTRSWRALAAAAEGDEAPLRAELDDPAAATPWLAAWRARLAQAGGDATARAAALRAANPWVIPRNHRVEEALAAASDDGDLAPFQALLSALRRPFDDGPGQARYAEPAPRELTACYKTFCGT